MSEISIAYIDHMGDDLRVSNVARVSFAKWKEEFDKQDERLINYLATHEHSSPFRHTAISIRCKAPVFLARQLAKHQAGLSWNEVSRRYVDTGIEFYVPSGWRSRPADGIKQGSGGVSEFSCEVAKEYQWLMEQSVSVYDAMLLNNIAPEMARMVLPQSMMVDWIWTGNLLSFFHIYRLRSGAGSQEEAKMFAELIEPIMKELFPVCWEALKND
jgi:thymidylate synthase (FAD)